MLLLRIKPERKNVEKNLALVGHFLGSILVSCSRSLFNEDVVVVVVSAQRRVVSKIFPTIPVVKRIKHLSSFR